MCVCVRHYDSKEFQFSSFLFNSRGTEHVTGTLSNEATSDMGRVVSSATCTCMYRLQLRSCLDRHSVKGPGIAAAQHVPPAWRSGFWLRLKLDYLT